jgi:CrcB protein
LQQIANTPLIAYVVVALGSAVGGLARYVCGLFIAERVSSDFAWGTLFVNVSGSFLIGVFAACTDPGGRWANSPLLRELLMVGLMGGYTTFSSFSLQTFAFLREGRLGFAMANVVASVVLCLVVVWLGYAMASAGKSAG